MSNILITGADGFIGKNLLIRLQAINKHQVFSYDINLNATELNAYLLKADIIFHLAGVNRPEKEEEYDAGNFQFTKTLIEYLEKNNKKPVIVFSSSIQAELDNPYGKSKKKAEDALLDYSGKNGTDLFIFRLKNVFGKWSRPDYNSVVSTFCYNISHNKDIWIQDKEKTISLIYIDDIMERFLLICEKSEPDTNVNYYYIKPDYEITLGELSSKLYGFKSAISRNFIPDFSNSFDKKLFAVFLSYYKPSDLETDVELKVDQRGWLFELLKSNESGQIFISTTKPGITRGNHYHHTKIEKFCLIKGKAIIKLRKIDDNTVYSFPVTDDQIKVINIPPGYTHSIQNISEQDEIIVIFWANEILNPEKPDTFPFEV